MFNWSAVNTNLMVDLVQRSLDIDILTYTTLQFHVIPHFEVLA